MLEERFRHLETRLDDLEKRIAELRSVATIHQVLSDFQMETQNAFRDVNIRLTNEIQEAVASILDLKKVVVERNATEERLKALEERLAKLENRGR